MGEAREAGSEPKESPSSQEPDAHIGTTLSAGRYRILRRVGPGRAWRVYAGVDERLERGVAIKFFTAAPLRTAEVRERFVRAVKATSQIDHPNIITVYDVGYDEHGCYVVMELLQERHVGHRLADGEQYLWPVATRMLAECCSALAAAHKAGFLHGDIKPDNLMFSRADEVKLVDFGLTKLLGESSPEVGLGAWGTPLYVSPEQATGRSGDARSDLYSLGATYYAMLTGQPPFPGSDPKQILRAHLYSPMPDPRALVPEVAEPCVQILRRAMEKEPTARYQDAEELAADLAALLSQAHRRSADEPSGLTASRRDVLVSTMVGVLGILGGDYALRRSARLSQDSGRDCGSGAPGEMPQLSKVPPRRDEPPIKVGILHSLSGPLADSEHPLSEAALLAIEELNELGGVLGRKLVPVVQDGQSEAAIDSDFNRVVASLLEREKVSVLFGCYGPQGRKGILPLLEKHRQLLFYSAPYEGLEESPQVIYGGSIPNQLGIPALRWCIEALGAKRFFFIGTDALRAHVSCAFLEDAIPKLGCEMVGAQYSLVGESQFAAVVHKLREMQPQVILNMLDINSAVSFFRTLLDADISPRNQPVLSFTLKENDLAQFGSLSLQGHYVARTRFPAVEPGSEDRLANHFRKKYGAHRPVNESMEAAYYGVHLWAAAVEKAGSTETSLVRQALTRQEFVLGGVRLSVDPSTQHTWKVLQIGKIRSDNSIEVAHTAEAPLPPIPFPPPFTRAEWGTFSKNLYSKWGGNWANPQKPGSTPPSAGPPPGKIRRRAKT